MLASTSHDFWLSFLTPGIWKTLHMSIYAAYTSLVAHVAFGYLQSTTSLFATFAFFAGGILVTALHVFAGDYVLI